MAGTFYRLLIIYLVIGMCLHLGGVQTIASNEDFTTKFITYDPLDNNAFNNSYTGLNQSFQSNVMPDKKIATGVFGFIDTLASVFNFISFSLTGMVFGPILLFTTYQIPPMFAYFFGGTLMFGLIMGIIVLIRSGLSP